MEDNKMKQIKEHKEEQLPVPERDNEHIPGTEHHNEKNPGTGYYKGNEENIKGRGLNAGHIRKV
jgi:hypothetical protein